MLESIGDCESSSSRPGIVMMRLLYQDGMKLHSFDVIALHHVESFDDDHTCAALQNWAAFGHCDCFVKRVSFDNRVAAGHAQFRAFTDCTVARDGLLAGGGIAAVYQCASEAGQTSSSRLA